MQILIGIQARSTSTRLPGKCNLLLDDKTVMEHVIDRCNEAKEFLKHRKDFNTKVALLVPIGDSLAAQYKTKMCVFEGDETNVLKRYYDAATLYQSEYIVRITGDCPLIPPGVIASFLELAINNKLDYVENVDEKIRTSPDGWDCEVLNYKLLEYMYKNANTPEFTEHVTLMARVLPPPMIRRYHVFNDIDISEIKISVDTQENLDYIKTKLKSLRSKIELAKQNGLII